MEVKKNFFYSSLLLVSQYAFPLMIFPYTSRVLGVEKIGVLNWVDSIVEYFLLFATLGLSIIGAREIAKNKSNQEKIKVIFSELLILHLIFTLIIIILYLIIVLNQEKFYQFKELFFISIIKILFNVFLIEWLYKGLENFKYITIRTVSLKIVYVILILIFVKTKDDFYIFFFLTTLLTVFNALVNFWFAKDIFTFKNIDISPKKYVKSIITLGVYLLLASLYNTFNIVYLGIVHSKVSVGNYTTALKIYFIILGLFSALNTVLVPRLTHLWSMNDTKAFKGLIDKSLNFVISFSLPIITCGLILAPEIVFVIAGKGFEKANLCLRIIFPLIFVMGIAQILSNQILLALNNDNDILYSSFIGALVGIILNFCLVPYYGEIGTSVIILVAESIVTWRLFLACRKYIEIDIPYKLIMQNLIALVPYIIICLVISNAVDSKFLILLFSSILTIICFYFLNRFFIKNKVIIELLNLKIFKTN